MNITLFLNLGLIFMCLFLLSRPYLSLVALPGTFWIPISPLPGILSVLLSPPQPEGNLLCTGGHSLFSSFPDPHIWGPLSPQLLYPKLSTAAALFSLGVSFRFLHFGPGPRSNIVGTMSGSRSAPLLVGLILRTWLLLSSSVIP